MVMHMKGSFTAEDVNCVLLIHHLSGGCIIIFQGPKEHPGMWL